eukprot:TRINITY_DN17499_c0_g1_i2.p1 TRINITY_DN17499_c0_g1~~TRINITY_DN17499_c0_g1_i2.p1  ORF type:complete len:107 (-),score=22.98 TRINITY_DN17499_c0_g1_i2:15-335(-)
MRLGAERMDFFKNGWNIFDLAAAVLILVFFVAFYMLRHVSRVSKLAHEEDLLELILFIIRYLMQTARVCILMKSASKAHSTNKYIKDIEFELGDRKNSSDKIHEEL